MPFVTARAWRRAWLTALSVAIFAAPAWPAHVAPMDARAADTLAARGAGGNDRKALEAWSARVSLTDLMWILRRPGRELDGDEPLLVRAALARCPAERVALRRRLSARLAEPTASARRVTDTPAPAAPVARPAASVFRIGVMLPDSGDYAEYSGEIWIGLEAGLASLPAGGHR